MPVSPYLLPESPDVDADVLRLVRNDYARFADAGLPPNLEEHLAERYQLDVTAEYAGFPLKNPWGKASGQLSMTARQVAEDVDAGLAFVVLKTVIAQDAAGKQMMEAWAIKEARMVAEPIVGKSGEPGWTVSWKGRGWWHSFDEYLQLVRDAQQIAAGRGTLVVPSCKYHLPTPDEQSWKVEEYAYTTPRLLEAWRSAAGGPRSQAPAWEREAPAWEREAPAWEREAPAWEREAPAWERGPMPLEKDFSPTLAGSDRATAQGKILEWLGHVPALVREAVGRENVRIGLKVFNSLFDDEFQLAMLRSIHAAGDDRPNFYIYGNRLFDPDREFDGKRGIAYGGPDLSDRNLRVMSQFQKEAAAVRQPGCSSELLPWSATGNITTGRMALEYALRGAGSFQLHTFFQLPADQYAMKVGSKTEKALCELYFHPQTGFVVWMHHLSRALNLPTTPIRFLSVVGRGRQWG